MKEKNDIYYERLRLARSFAQNMRHFFRAAQEKQLFFLFYDRKKIGSVNNIRESETDEYNNKNILVKKTKRTKTE